ncbi:glycosyltransferase involved in cell wall biosynthesis [Marinobacterium halophilum]|uniref:Glycosyltransferase involved in cell wall biosynthesis n=1 Tax=Marinobacterium halophilum TaxID=267374 RepID=A0A2P8ETY0_9GAMM|nr:glycosyltransferase [Marinobacterium halophilum]PSL12940.1 glycosyltransferase involved in cell wall biosynthesis [Marinobacterium halophilum]
MKVAHVIIGLNVGGAELMLKRLIESHSQQSDIEHVVISLTDQGVLGGQLNEQGVELHCLGMFSIAKGPAAFFKLRKLLRRLRPDVVHTWMYHADLLGGLAASSVGLRNLVWCIRSTDIRKGGSKVTLLIRKLCAWLSGRLPRVIVCAADASRQVHETVGYAPNKMQVIPNGFDLDKLLSTHTSITSIRDDLGISHDCKLVVSVGRYNPVKDHKTFIKAAGKVAAQRNGVKFMLVGRDLEHSNPQLMALIDATGQADAFYLLGERNDVSACLQASDVFCLHSVTEGFPNVLGEAMAVGLPCVTTDVGDAAYLLDKPEWVVPAASPDRLAEKLSAMLSLPVAERAALGDAAATRIREHFTMDVISRRYYDLYTSLINSK